MVSAPLCDYRNAPTAPAESSYNTLISKALGVDVSAQGQERGTVRIRTDRSLPPEAYTLKVGAQAIEILASSYEGIARGASSLAAYRLQAGSGFEAIRACEISDSPRYRWRGVMVDVARHIFPLSVIESFLDSLFYHKVNVLHLHLTDDQGWRFPVEGWPELMEYSAYRDDRTTEYGSYGGYYSAAELAALDAYAADLGITIVPEIDLPGHTRSIFAAYPELSCRGERLAVPTRWGIFDDVLCVGNEKSFEFVGAAVRSLAEIFRGPYIHLGGDETPTVRWAECPRCNERREREGISDPEELHAYFMARAAEAVRGVGKLPVVWDEAISPRLSRETYIMCWRGRGCVERALQAGFPVVAVPQERACYFDHKHLDEPGEPGRLGVCTVRNASEYDPGESPTDRLLGVQGNLWSEEILYGRQLEYMAYPRLSALAANGWSGNGPWEERSSLLTRQRHRLIDAGVQAYPGALE